MPGSLPPNPIDESSLHHDVLMREPRQLRVLERTVDASPTQRAEIHHGVRLRRGNRKRGRRPAGGRSRRRHGQRHVVFPHHAPMLDITCLDDARPHLVQLVLKPQRTVRQPTKWSPWTLAYTVRVRKDRRLSSAPWLAMRRMTFSSSDRKNCFPAAPSIVDDASGTNHLEKGIYHACDRGHDSSDPKPTCGVASDT